VGSAGAADAHLTGLSLSAKVVTLTPAAHAAPPLTPVRAVSAATLLPVRTSRSASPRLRGVALASGVGELSVELGSDELEEIIGWLAALDLL
jgi:hypothetical protein